MPDEEKNQPPQRSTEGESTPEKREFSLHEDSARDGEILKASGARPSPNPDPDPQAPEGPVNRAAEFSEATLHETPVVVDTQSEGQTEAAPPPPPPPPPPTTDSSKGEA